MSARRQDWAPRRHRPGRRCSSSTRLGGSVPTGERRHGMAEASLEAQLEDLLDQETFSPSSEFAGHAVISDPEVYERASQDPEGFWAEQARALDWAQEPEQVLDWSDPPFAKWFVGGKLNVAYNC